MLPARTGLVSVFVTLAFINQPVQAQPVAQNANSPFVQLEKLQQRGAKVSALVVDLRTGKTLAELNPDRRLSPASVSKLVLGAAVLDRFGSDHTFKTRLYAEGSDLSYGILKGNLIFEGAGDPYLTNEKLWFLATDVARMGIKEIAGDLVINTSLFGEIELDSNRAAGQGASRNAYDSPLSAAAVNFSVFGVVASPSFTPGLPGVVALEPYPLDSVKVSGSVKTVNAGPSQLQAVRVKGKQHDNVTVTGQIAAGAGPSRLYRSVSDADAYAGSVIKSFLESAGVTIKGKVRVSNNPLKGTEKLLTSVDGFPIDWQLRGLFKVSNNFIADMLTIQLDTGRGEVKKATLKGGNQALEAYMHDTLLQTKLENVPPPGNSLVLKSGSGLTPENRLSSRDVIAVLDRMFKNKREYPNFLATLPIPGSEGTVKKRFKQENEKHLRDSLRAKTRTLSEPVDAVALAGYSRLKDGDWVALSAIVNGTAQQPSFGIEAIRDAIDADIARILPVER